MSANPVSGRSPVGGDLAHIGHVELLTPRLEESVRCFTDVLGMTVVSTDGDSVHLRGESEYELSGLKLTASDRPGVGHIGVRTRDAEALARRTAALTANGVDGAWNEGDVGHGPAYAFRAPDGHAIELYWETERFVPEPPPSGLPPLARDRLGRRGGAGVDVRRLDHVSLLAADVARAASFAWGALGFSLYDEVVEDDGSVSGAWLSLGPRPLELVYARDRLGGTGRLHHAAFWVDTREEVLRAADIFVDRRCTHRGRARPAHHRPQLLPLRLRARRQPHRGDHRRRARARPRPADADLDGRRAPARGGVGDHLPSELDRVRDPRRPRVLADVRLVSPLAHSRLQRLLHRLHSL